MNKEVWRQIFHLALGFVAISILLILGKNFLMAGAFLILLAGMLLINQLILGRKIGLVDLFVKYLERDDVIFPGWGSAAYAAGVLILVTALDSVPQMAAGIFVLAVGDSFSTIVGRRGKIRIPYNKRKTLEGTIAFFASSLLGYYFVGPLIIPVAIVAALLESFDWPLDDNLVIPIGCAIMFILLG